MTSEQKKIFIIEDHRPIAKALELKLAHAGFATKTASDGEKALQILSQETFDLIVLDLVVPKIDGFTFLEEIKKRGLSSPKVIVVSNLSQPEDIKRAKELGVSTYFVKSDTPLKTIVEHITHMVEQKTEAWTHTTI